MNPLKAGDIAPKFSLPDQDESHDPRLYRTGLRLTR